MQLTNIKLNNFRNHVDIEINNLDKINLIIGVNGSGKTSITEAINLSTIGRSFKTSELNELINFDHKQANVDVEYKKNILNKISIILSDKNNYQHNESSIKRNDLYSKIISLIFEPTIFSNFFNDKSYRRKYIDNEISKIYPVHKFNLSSVKKIERDKKELLKFKYNEKLIKILNTKLSKLYFQISDSRSKFTTEINKYYFDILDTFNIKSNKSNLIYDSIFKNKNHDQIISILEKVSLQEKNDKKIINTINYDNFDIEVDNKSIVKFGSQGQQRITFLTFIFSTAKLIYKKINFQPIIILDDVFSELDEENQESLINKFKEFGQFFITTTDTKIHINQANIIEIK